MSASHVDPLPGKPDIYDNDNAGLVEEVRRVVGMMTNSLVNAYRNERSKNDAMRAGARINQAVRLLFTRYNGDLIEE